MTKRIEILHFGPMCAARGRSEEVVSTEAATPGDLYAELGLGASYPASALRVAVNDRLTSWDAPLGDGDRVVFLSPSSGG